MANINNIPLKKYKKFLESQGCKCNRKSGGHMHYSRRDIDRPITLQSRIDPVPVFIIRQHLRYLDISKKEFLEKIDEL